MCHKTKPNETKPFMAEYEINQKRESISETKLGDLYR